MLCLKQQNYRSGRSLVEIITGSRGGLEYEAKQLRWLGLILILAGAMSLGLTACEKKESETPSDPGHIVLDDYEIQYKALLSCRMWMVSQHWS